MSSIGKRRRLLSLKAATTLARGLFCALAATDLFVLGTVAVSLIAGGPALVMVGIAQVSGSSSNNGFASFALFSGILAVATFTMWRLQVWLNRTVITSIIIEDVISRIAPAQEQLAQELRTQLAANLATLPDRTLLRKIEVWMPIKWRLGGTEPQTVFTTRTCWETANMTARAVAEQFDRRQAAQIESRRLKWCRETAPQLPAFR